MEITVNGRVLLKFFVTLYPVFKQALPDKNRANGDLSIQNNITKIRHYFHIIPLTVPSVDLDQTKFDDSSFSQALHSLLEVFEDLVDGVRRRYDNRKPHFVESEV
jgi:hypothetical protein